MYVVVNAAMSADGKLSSHHRSQVQISGPTDADRVNGLRAASDAIMVGIGTVLADDPNLTVDEDRAAERDAAGRPPQPTRVVADSRARTPASANVLDDTAPTHLLVSEQAPDDRVESLREAGATIITAGTEQVDLIGGVSALGNAGIKQLMVEGGGELIFSFFDAELVDELSVYIGPLIIGGREAPTLADGDGFAGSYPGLILDGVDQIDDGVLLRFSVRGRSPRRT